jgi:MFS family permease
LEAISGELRFGHSASLQGLVVSSLLSGAALGSLAAGVLADHAGRRKALLVASVPMLLGPLVSANATGLSGMIVGRLVTGAGVGLSSSLVPLYVAEIAPTNARGTCGSLNQLMICTGILLALLANLCLDPTEHWRTTFAMSAVPAFALFWGMLLWCVDSPSDARTNSCADSGFRTIAAQSNIKTPPPRRLIGVWLSCALFLCQQLSGINTVIYFSSRVFQEAGVVGGPSGAVLASIAVGVFNIAGTLVAMTAIEKAGRRSLLIASYAGMATTMFVMGASFVVTLSKAYSHAITLFGTVLFVMSFALGSGPVTGLLIPELNDARTRGLAVSAAMATHWIANIAVGQGFLPAVHAVGLSSVYLCFSAFGALAILFVAKCIPETRGKSFEQIQIELASQKQVSKLPF